MITLGIWSLGHTGRDLYISLNLLCLLGTLSARINDLLSGLAFVFSRFRSPCQALQPLQSPHHHALSGHHGRRGERDTAQ
jgi:hypothetical protein